MLRLSLVMGLPPWEVASWPQQTVAAFIALWDVDGPWTGLRGDVQAAVVAQNVRLAAGIKTDLTDVLLDWNGQHAEPPTFDDVFHLFRNED